jgi:uncharacterized surface protein with fasciclin (FAS1) repeats
MKYGKLFLFLAFVFALAFAFAPDSASAGPKGPSIVDVAVYANSPEGPFPGAFDTLLAAVGEANPAVAATLAGNGQHTVFAPTDAAFEKIGLNPDNIGDVPEETLTQILLYHVANGRRDAADVTTSSQIRTLQRGFIQVDGAVLNGDINIIVTDVFAANGVIHAIDGVLLPG